MVQVFAFLLEGGGVLWVCSEDRYGKRAEEANHRGDTARV